MNRRHHAMLAILAHCYTTPNALVAVVISRENGRADDILRDIRDVLPMVNEFTKPATVSVHTVKRDGSTASVELLVSEGKLGFKSKIVILKPQHHGQMDEIRGAAPTAAFADTLVSPEHMNILAAQIGRRPASAEKGIQLWTEPGLYSR
jgi:hypothetical protein